MMTNTRVATGMAKLWVGGMPIISVSSSSWIDTITMSKVTNR